MDTSHRMRLTITASLQDILNIHPLLQLLSQMLPRDWIILELHLVPKG